MRRGVNVSIGPRGVRVRPRGMRYRRVHIPTGNPMDNPLGLPKNGDFRGGMNNPMDFPNKTNEYYDDRVAGYDYQEDKSNSQYNDIEILSYADVVSNDELLQTIHMFTERYLDVEEQQGLLKKLFKKKGQDSVYAGRKEYNTAVDTYMHAGDNLPPERLEVIRTLLNQAYIKNPQLDKMLALRSIVEYKVGNFSVALEMVEQLFALDAVDPRVFADPALLQVKIDCLIISERFDDANNSVEELEHLVGNHPIVEDMKNEILIGLGLALPSGEYDSTDNGSIIPYEGK